MREYAAGARCLTWCASIFGAFAVLGGFSCNHRSAENVERPLEVAWTGCAAVGRSNGGIACELGDARTLTLVVPEGTEETKVIAGSRSGVASSDRRRFTIDVPEDATIVTAFARVANEPARFTLRVERFHRLEWLEQARAMRARGDIAGARRAATEHEESVDDRERGLAKGMLARLALGEGRAADAFPLFREAIDLDRRAGRVSDAVDDSFALAFALHQRSHRYAEARVVLDATLPEVPWYADGAAREPYYRGLLASETGDRRGALGLLRRAEERAHVLGMTRLERNAKMAIALEMQSMGRARAALDVLRALEKEPDATPCERVELENNLGWGAIVANEAAGDHAEDAHGPLTRAIAVEGCTDAYLASFALANLARLEIDEGHVDEGARRLAAARAAVKEPRGTERMEWLDLEGRIAAARKKPAAALALFDEELAFARAAVLLDYEWSALVGRADALDALGKTNDAVAALASAEDLVDRAMRLVPLGEGRGTFVADRSRSARRAIELLVKGGHAADAARVAGRSRARLLDGIARSSRIERLSGDERARWELAVRAYRSARDALDAEAANDWTLPRGDLASIETNRKGREHELSAALDDAMAVLSRGDDDDLPSPERGDLDLYLHPLAKGWIAIAVDASGATTHPVPAPDGTTPDALGHALLDPLASRIDAAQRLRVRAYGPWRAVDVHALPFRDGPLVASVAVDYPVGVRARAAQTSSTRTLVVGDPNGDLPVAFNEAQIVSRTLHEATVLTRHAASSDAVVTALSSVGFFHYAGHGVFAGIDGWDSALPLADGGRLTIGDVLSLAHTPRRVVLSGCDAARSDGDAEGLGIAQAFVAAGSDAVIAPVRPVSDALALSFAARLYRDVDGGVVDERPAVALRRAALQLRANGVDWAAFRVLAR